MHVKFYEAEIWEKWGSVYLADPMRFVVDLRGASSEDEIIDRLRDVLKATKYPTVTPFLGLDALGEVLSDFFCERWNVKTEIYIVGWREVADVFPLFCQKIICVFFHSYCNTVWKVARAVSGGGEDIKKARIHENIFEGIHVFLILN